MEFFLCCSCFWPHASPDIPSSSWPNRRPPVVCGQTRTWVVAKRTQEALERKHVAEEILCKPAGCHSRIGLDAFLTEEVGVHQHQTAVRMQASSLCRNLNQLLDETTDVATLASLLKRCGKMNALSDGRIVHAHIKQYGHEHNVSLGNCLLQMYCDCGRLDYAQAVFDNLPDLHLFSWTMLINAYAKNGHGRKALDIFHQMEDHGFKADQIAFLAALDACASMAALEEGQKIHAAIVQSGYQGKVVVATSLVNMYGKCRSLVNALSVFGLMPQRNVVSWNSMIAVYVQNGHGKDALDLFHRMQADGFKPDRITFLCIVDACASLGALQEGQKIHAIIVERCFEGQLALGTALLNMYSKCGSLHGARSVFGEMPHQDVASWSAMIAAFVQNGQGKEAVLFFHQMQLDGFKPNQITFGCVIDAYASMAALEEGLEIHAEIINNGYEREVIIGTALVNMYGKCGSMCKARRVFGQMPRRDVVCWSVMIAACAQNGYEDEALALFEQMQVDGVKPNEITFLGVLSACCHTGRVVDGRRYFFLMNEHGLTHTLEHYVCMVDLLGRAGHLDDAENLINSMPSEKNVALWLSLLGACRVHCDIERGVRAAGHLFTLDPTNATPYITLANIYATVGRWDDAQKVKEALQKSDVKRQLGHSCIEVSKRIHEFGSRGLPHPQKEEIEKEWESLSRQIEEAGYEPDQLTKFNEEDIATEGFDLSYHSEKLALVFGLMSTPPGTTLRITKNIRMCPECHAATKFISNIVQRKILLRDSTCFHQFENGLCSCRDYW